MPPYAQIFETLIAAVVGIAVMVLLATITFFITTFAVAAGSRLAGYDPSGDFVVLSAALIVVAVIIAGGLTVSTTRQAYGWPDQPADTDPTYD